LLAGLRERGGAVASFLPPYAWVVLGGKGVADWLAAQPHTLMVGGGRRAAVSCTQAPTPSITQLLPPPAAHAMGARIAPT